MVDIKTNEWLNDPRNDRYLRPETLFGTKFESYRQERREPRKNASNDLTREDVNSLLGDGWKKEQIIGRYPDAAQHF